MDRILTRYGYTGDPVQLAWHVFTPLSGYPTELASSPLNRVIRIFDEMHEDMQYDLEMEYPPTVAERMQCRHKKESSESTEIKM